MKAADGAFTSCNVIAQQHRNLWPFLSVTHVYVIGEMNKGDRPAGEGDATIASRETRAAIALRKLHRPFLYAGVVPAAGELLYAQPNLIRD